MGADSRELGGSAQELSLRQEIDNFLCKLFHRIRVAEQFKIGMFGSFVRIRDAGEMLDLSCQSLLIQPFWIALHADFDRSVHVDFDECS